MRAILAVAIGLALAGCATGLRPEEIAAADQARCAEYGFPVGHPDHGTCRLALDQQRIDAELAAAARNAALATSLGAYSQYMQATQPAPMMMPAVQPLQPYSFGGTTHWR